MAKQKVLVVDDEQVFLQLVHLILQRAGYEPILAGDASTALELVEKHSPAALILDDDMPGMSGGDLCYRLKHDRETENIAIVMFSANDRILDPVYMDRIRADGAVQKPCMPRDILSALEASLQAHAGV